MYAARGERGFAGIGETANYDGVFSLFYYQTLHKTAKLLLAPHLASMIMLPGSLRMCTDPETLRWCRHGKLEYPPDLRV